MQRTAIQTWRDFASAVVDETDPEKLTELITQLNQELADIDSRPQAADVASKQSES